VQDWDRVLVVATLSRLLPRERRSAAAFSGRINPSPLSYSSVRSLYCLSMRAAAPRSWVQVVAVPGDAVRGSSLQHLPTRRSHQHADTLGGGTQIRAIQVNFCGHEPGSIIRPAKVG